MCLDEETTTKHEFIGRKENGMPEAMGEKTEVMGAHFEIWKQDDNEIDDALRQSMRELCQGVGQALNRYYAFGNVFSEDL
jgi:UDP-2,3-diacylglucosamine pyrophosphatase LpxH